MREPTIEVPVSELARVAKLGLEKLHKRAEDKWKEFIDKEMEKRWFGYGPKMWAHRSLAEDYHGKVEKVKDIDRRTRYNKYFGDSRQLKQYRDFIELNKNRPSPETLVTMLVDDYNVLMTWDD